MRFLQRCLACLLLALSGCLLSGCIAEGHRRVSVKILGQELTFEDQVTPNSKGDQEYKCGFDEDSNVVKWLFGWLTPTEETDDDNNKPEP